MVAFLFPGQGSQTTGMGKALCDAYPVAQQTFEAADDALGMSISKICFEGPDEELKKTEITQPAILTTSVAVLRVLEAERDLRPSFLMGHSLGEWSALVAAGALDLADAVRLVKERGRLMQLAVPQGEGAMAAITGLSTEVVENACEKATSVGVVCPANFNSLKQIVISGSMLGVAAAVEQLKQEGGKATPLPVSAPFHCPLMEPAAKGLKEALTPITIHELATPVITNVEARPNENRERVKDLLVQQVTAPVRWVESIIHLIEKGETKAIEIGPGKVLTGLARRIDRALKVVNIDAPDTLAKTLKTV